MTRRQFLSASALAAPVLLHAKEETLKTALNAYSFNKLLNNGLKGRKGESTTLPAVLEFCAKNKIQGFDPTGYFFPGYPALPDPKYVDDLKKRAADLGVGISGTGVRNNFTTADKAVREAGVRHIKEWVPIAAQLGAPVIRVFADTQMRAQTWESVSNGAPRKDVQDWIAGHLRDCAEQGKKYGVKIGVQNHGDFLKTGQQFLDLIAAVDSPWCGPIVDTGYFKTPDPYKDMALVAPHAVNWQVKQSVFGQESDIPSDLVRIVKIARASGYKGYLPVETLSPKDKPDNPYETVPAFMDQLKAAIRATA